MSFRRCYSFCTGENERYKSLIIRNPHDIYLTDSPTDLNNQSELSSARNKSFVSNNNRYGMDEEKYSTIRKMPSSVSSTTLLRGYINHSNISSSNNSSSNTNAGTVNSKHSNDFGCFGFSVGH